MPSRARKRKSVPDVEIYIKGLINKCGTTFPYGKLEQEINRLIPFTREIDPALLRKLADAMDKLADRAGCIRDLANHLRFPHRLLKHVHWV